MRCWGFNYNFFDCEERCPFGTDSADAHVLFDKNYTVFGDSKCQYIIKEKQTEIDNIFIHKESDELLIYHSYDLFHRGNVNRTDQSFAETMLKTDKTVHMNEYLLVVNTADKPLKFSLSKEV